MAFLLPREDGKDLAGEQFDSGSEAEMNVVRFLPRVGMEWGEESHQRFGSIRFDGGLVHRRVISCPYHRIIADGCDESSIIRV
jgi:hypothetical protein